MAVDGGMVAEHGGRIDAHGAGGNKLLRSRGGLSGLFDSKGPAPYEPLDVESLPGNFVLLNVYDIGDMELFQRINRLSTVNDRVLVGGVYHAGVEIYGTEWGYGFTEEDATGVCDNPPRLHSQHTYRATVQMGLSSLSVQEVEVVLERLMAEWRGLDYNLIHHNCLDFATAFCKELGVGRIPGWVDRFGRTASAVDTMSKRAADGVHRTKQMARTMTNELSDTLSVASDEVPKLASVVGSNVARFSRGLFEAAAKAMGDRPPGALDKKDSRLRASLRNRGGVRAAAAASGAASAATSAATMARAAAGAAAGVAAGAAVGAARRTGAMSRSMSGGVTTPEEEYVDAFLLEGLLEEGDCMHGDALPIDAEEASLSTPSAPRRGLSDDDGAACVPATNADPADSAQPPELASTAGTDCSPALSSALAKESAAADLAVGSYACEGRSDAPNDAAGDASRQESAAAKVAIGSSSCECPGDAPSDTNGDVLRQESAAAQVATGCTPCEGPGDAPSDAPCDVLQPGELACSEKPFVNKGEGAEESVALARQPVAAESCDDTAG